MGKKKGFSTSGAETTGYPYGRKMGLGPYVSPHAKVNLRWIRDIMYKIRAINLLKEILGHFSHIVVGKDLTCGKH